MNRRPKLCRKKTRKLKNDKEWFELKKCKIQTRHADGINSVQIVKGEGCEREARGQHEETGRESHQSSSIYLSSPHYHLTSQPSFLNSLSFNLFHLKKELYRSLHTPLIT